MVQGLPRQVHALPVSVVVDTGGNAPTDPEELQ